MNLSGGGVEIGPALNIASPERNASTDGLQIDASATASAIVDQQTRVTVEEFVPEEIQPFDVFDFGDPLAIRCVIFTPVGQGHDVKILSIAVDSIFFDFGGDQIRQPSACFGQPQV
jgi:hypothetical protein